MVTVLLLLCFDGLHIYIFISKCPDGGAELLNIFIHHIFPTGIPQSVPYLYSHQEGRAPLGTSGCDTSSTSVHDYDEKSTAHHTQSAGESIPLFHRNREH